MTKFQFFKSNGDKGLGHHLKSEFNINIKVYGFDLSTFQKRNNRTIIYKLNANSIRRNWMKILNSCYILKNKKNGNTQGRIQTRALTCRAQFHSPSPIGGEQGEQTRLQDANIVHIIQLNTLTTTFL